MSLSSILPAPTQSVWDRDDDLKQKAALKACTALVVAQAIAPPYGQRRGWVPRRIEDFGDGGAFPEIHVVQHPLEMGQKGKESTSNALAVQLDAEGKVKYDVLTRQGHSKDKIVYSKLTDLLPAEVLAESDPSLQKPDQEEVDEITEKTRQVISDFLHFAQVLVYTTSLLLICYGRPTVQRTRHYITADLLFSVLLPHFSFDKYLC